MKVTRLLSALAALYVFWLLLSGYFTGFLMLAGLGCALCGRLVRPAHGCHRRRGSPGAARLAHRRLLGLAVEGDRQVGWEVSRIIVDPRLPISPTMVSFKPSQKTTVGLVVHANSITLTPGTITVEARPGEFLVHALTRAGAEGTTSGDMDRRVSALRRGPLMFVAVGSRCW